MLCVCVCVCVCVCSYRYLLMCVFFFFFFFWDLLTKSFRLYFEIKIFRDAPLIKTHTLAYRTVQLPVV